MFDRQGRVSNLPECLRSVAEVADEGIVVDTGDWVLLLDADERLITGAAARL